MGSAPKSRLQLCPRAPYTRCRNEAEPVLGACGAAASAQSPESHTQSPESCTQNSIPYPEPKILPPELRVLPPEPRIPHPDPRILHPAHRILHPEPGIPHPEPGIPYPEPRISHPVLSGDAPAVGARPALSLATAANGAQLQRGLRPGKLITPPHPSAAVGTAEPQQRPGCAHCISAVPTGTAAGWGGVGGGVVGLGGTCARL